MGRSLEAFANLKGAVTSQVVQIDTKLAKKIIAYREPALKLTQFCYPYQMDDLVDQLPKDPGSTNMAVEVAEGSEVPLFRTRWETQTISLHKNATAYFITKEALIRDATKAQYEKEAKDAGRAMARKTDYDISNVLIVGPATSASAVIPGLLTQYDVTLAIADMLQDEMEASDILINPTQWADIESEAVVTNITFDADPTKNALKAQPIWTSEAAKYAGKSGQGATFAGLRVHLINKITAGTAIIIAADEEPVWLCYYGSTDTEPFTEPGVGKGAIVTAYECPIMMKAEAVYKIVGC